MLKLDLILYIMNQIDNCLKEKIKKVTGLLKDELRGKIMIEFVELRGKTYSYLLDDASEDKKEKGTKECVMKRKLKFETYKISLEATQLENKINHLEKMKLTQTVIRKIIKNS